MWVIVCFFGLLCSERFFFFFFFGYSGFRLSPKTQIELERMQTFKRALKSLQCFVGKQIIMLKLGKNSGYVGYRCLTLFMVRHE